MKKLMEIKRLQVMQKNRSSLNSRTRTITRWVYTTNKWGTS
jgi:hypothetical protein